MNLRDDPAACRAVVADIERCASPTGRARVGMAVVEGVRVVERAVRCGRAPAVALVAQTLVREPSTRERTLIEALARAGTRVLPAPDGEVARLMAGRGGGAIVGLVPLPEPVDPATFARIAPEGVFLVLAGVEDPGNVGALARTALASGVDALVALAPADPFHPKAVRTSMGAVLKLPIASVSAGGAAIDALRQAGVRLFGAVARGGRALPQVRFPRPVAVVLGSESFGIAEDVERRLDGRVTIPMSRDADSFSVNAAAAVLLYEVWRSEPSRDGSV